MAVRGDYMPDTPWPVLLWIKESKYLKNRRRWIAPAPVYLAAVMLMLAGLLIAGVTAGLNGVNKNGEISQSSAAVERPNPVQSESIQPVTINAVSTITPVADQSGEKSAYSEQEICRPLKGETRLAFGWRQHPVFQDWRYHTGIDISAAAGSPVKALYGGKVSKIYSDRDYGTTVVVDSGKRTVYYSSLKASKVAVGQSIPAGTVIGTVGSSAVEPYDHLHLSVKIADKYVDPQEILAGIQ